jgi:DNA topoisomerase-2
MATQLEKDYQKKTDKEHILDNPDTYIGSVENVNTPLYICDEEGKIVQNQMNYNPGLYKLFDEAIVNCRDHVTRMEEEAKKNKDAEQVTSIQIDISDDIITMTNNGNGIDIIEHPTYKTWIPEMIFAHLRTSTNYNKDKKKITGGKNGFGIKLVFIWSSWGEIETVDHTRGLMYKQTFKQNLDIIEKPKITKCKKKPYTTIRFKPDYERLQLTGLSKDIIGLFKRRVYDIAGITNKKVKVKYNSELIQLRDFQHYVNLYNDKDKIFEKANERWEFGICLSDEFTQVSFVNGIFTSKGGKHVEYITNQIVKKMCALILKKKKITVKASVIKEQIMIFVNSTIENPTFDSQTKDFLNTPSSKFGSSCEVSDKFIDKLAKMGVLNTSCELSELKEKKNAKKTDGKQSKTIRGIPKLVDANYAGTVKSNMCTLILCEGDSAKSGIISGLSNEDRNTIGVYPMKGKIFNVRGELMKRINENKEINEIKKIMGFEIGKTYETINSLRYGKILFMTDQDLDGSHIKGLGINLIEYMWPSLLKIDGFIGFMNTPILKATKGSNILSFYNEGEYDAWKHENSEGKGWKIKYYKGLGTSTGKEFKEYFKARKTVEFNSNENDHECVDMVFNKKRACDRKIWLEQYDKDRYMDVSKTNVSINDFLNDEFSHFSKYDCERSIPSAMDGLKKSQRKIIFAAFKKNLNQEIKVAQFSGYVSENSGYHHGEASLNAAIVNMAQDFIGSNNVNLLMPNGQFGTRIQGGKDSASERYIFTKLNPISRKIFIKEDDSILNYINDDGQMVEPEYYSPIVPMILVNGTKGIGTGFSTEIPCYNLNEIINYILGKINNQEMLEYSFIPYYNGFNGTIEVDPDNNKRYITKGIYRQIKETIVEITELPIGTWTEDYIVFLEKQVNDEKSLIKDYKDKSTDKKIHIMIEFKSKAKITMDSTFEKNMKLCSYLSTTNMNLFDKDQKLKHYDNVCEIMDEFIVNKLEHYKIRKDYMLKQLKSEIEILKNKFTYIEELLNDTIDLRKKKSAQINQLLEDKNYIKIENSYNYLIKMSMDSVCEENVDKLKSEFMNKKKEHDILHGQTIQNMWNIELEELKKVI